MNLEYMLYFIFYIFIYNIPGLQLLHIIVENGSYLDVLSKGEISANNIKIEMYLICQDRDRTDTRCGDAYPYKSIL